MKKDENNLFWFQFEVNSKYGIKKVQNTFLPYHWKSKSVKITVSISDEKG